jgi:hypothetical protein
MERSSKNYLSFEYLKGIFLALYTFVYMFFYTILYPPNNRRTNDNINRGSTDPGNSNNRRGGGNGRGSQSDYFRFRRGG